MCCRRWRRTEGFAARRSMSFLRWRRRDDAIRFQSAIGFLTERSEGFLNSRVISSECLRLDFGHRFFQIGEIIGDQNDHRPLWRRHIGL